MVEISVIIPQRDQSAAIREQLPGLCRTLTQLAGTYEILLVDDGSSADTLGRLRQLQSQYEPLRLIRLNQPLGVSAAITAGVRHAQGDAIVAIEAGNRYPTSQIKKLLSATVRSDLVFGRRRLSATERIWHRVTRLPRWLMLGLDVHEPDTLFWAARRDALERIDLPRGMYRYLGTFVAMQGYRVGEVYVDTEGAARPLRDVWPNPADFLCAWWISRRWQPSDARDLSTEKDCPPVPLPLDADGDSLNADPVRKAA